MKRFGFEIGLALLLGALYAVFWLWQTPGVLHGPLQAAEVEDYLRIVEERLPMPAQEKPEVVRHLRAWALADDGRPVYMLNLMRYYPELRRFEGTPRFDGTAQQSNAHYEAEAMPLLMKIGGYPLVGGMTQGANLIEHSPALDDWSRVLVVRYPSRRAFLELLTDPAYAPIEPYKLMALQVVLTPVHGELVVPELRWSAAAALLVLFLLVAWVRALRRVGAR
jgi:uncharacterized protein (DUF1330 family)